MYARTHTHTKRKRKRWRKNKTKNFKHQMKCVIIGNLRTNVWLYILHSSTQCIFSFISRLEISCTSYADTEVKRRQENKARVDSPHEA